MSFAKVRATRAGEDLTLRELIDFLDALFDTGVAQPGTASQFTMRIPGDSARITVEGQGFSFRRLDGEDVLIAGTLQKISVRDGGVLLGTIETSITAATLGAVISAEDRGNRSAIEDFLLGLSWDYVSGGAVAERAPQSLRVGDNVPFNPRGDDKFVLSKRADVFFAGDGDDLVRGRGGDDKLYGGRGNDRLFGDGGDDMLYGGPGADRLFGGPGADQLFGGAGNDQLFGGGGRDRLNGGGGNDILNGGAGNDVLTGGAGRDTFVFGNNSGKDVITDFGRGNNTIDLSARNDVGRFADIRNKISQDGNNAVIDLGRDEIVLRNFQASDLSSSDFIF